MRSDEKKLLAIGKYVAGVSIALVVISDLAPINTQWRDILNIVAGVALFFLFLYVPIAFGLSLRKALQIRRECNYLQIFHLQDKRERRYLTMIGLAFWLFPLVLAAISGYVILWVYPYFFVVGALILLIGYFYVSDFLYKNEIEQVWVDSESVYIAFSKILSVSIYSDTGLVNLELDDRGYSFRVLTDDISMQDFWGNICPVDYCNTLEE